MKIFNKRFLIPLFFYVICCNCSHSHQLPPIDRKLSSNIFSYAGKSDGLEIWRYETTQPLNVGRQRFGKFHEGDAYIILKTQIEDEMNDTVFSIHYWLGLGVSPKDEARVVIMAQMLQRILKNSTIHREVEKNESSNFINYFPSGVQYYPGSLRIPLYLVSTDFVNSDEKAVNRLYQVKGEKKVFIRNLNPMVNSLNADDCFVVDCVKTIYIYFGNSSSPKEKKRAWEYARWLSKIFYQGWPSILSTNGDNSKNHLKILRHFKAFKTKSENSTFDVQSSTLNDSQYEQNILNNTSLYVITESFGMWKVLKKPFYGPDLLSNVSAILDTTWAIFVWKGYKTLNEYVEEALTQAMILKETKKYPLWVPIEIISEFLVPATFKQFFSHWSLRPPLPLLVPAVPVKVDSDAG